MSVITYDKISDSLYICKDKHLPNNITLILELGIVTSYEIIGNRRIVYSIRIYNVTDRLKNLRRFKGILNTCYIYFKDTSSRKILEVINA